jgi:hypothetical protein
LSERPKRLLISLVYMCLIALFVDSLVSSEEVTWVPSPLDPISLATFLRISFSFAIPAILVTCLVVLIVYRQICVEMLKTILRSRGRVRRQSSLGVVAGLLIFLLIIYVLRISGVGNQTGGDAVPGGGVAPFAPVLPIDGSITTSPLYPVYGYATVILMFAVASVGVFIAIRAFREMRQEAEITFTKQQYSAQKDRSAATALRETLINFEAEEDLRSAVVRCYRRVCDILAGHGFGIEAHQTAREFEAGIASRMNLLERPFSRLTDLFEEARYSLHEIDEAKRKDAVECLTNIRGHFAGEADSL